MRLMRERGGKRGAAKMVALGREEVAWEAGERLGSERIRVMEGDWTTLGWLA